jgi:hypothetical protein
MPEELAGGRCLSNGLCAHRGQADRGLVIDPGRRTPACPSPAGLFPPLLRERVTEMNDDCATHHSRVAPLHRATAPTPSGPPR